MIAYNQEEEHMKNIMMLQLKIRNIIDEKENRKKSKNDRIWRI